MRRKDIDQEGLEAVRPLEPGVVGMRMDGVRTLFFLHVVISKCIFAREQMGLLFR
jgi:hypothetical protein